MTEDERPPIPYREVLGMIRNTATWWRARVERLEADIADERRRDGIYIETLRGRIRKLENK